MTIGHLLLPPSQSRSGVSRVQKPLALARALLGRYHCGRSCCSQWATVSTRHLRGSQSWLGITGDVGLGKRKAGQGRSGKPVVCRVLAVEWCSICSLYVVINVSDVAALCTINAS